MTENGFILLALKFFCVGSIQCVEKACVCKKGEVRVHVCP